MNSEETNERAQRIAHDEQELFNDAKRSLEVDQEKTEDNVRPVEAKPVKDGKTVQGTSQPDTTVVSRARRVFAFVLGFILASAFSHSVAESITTYGTKVLFFKSYTVNIISVWFVICTSVMMLIGKFHKTDTEKWCGMTSGNAMFFLYIQYVRTVERMEHYIIFSIAFLIGCAILCCIFASKKMKWNCAPYFEFMAFVLGCFPILFVIYAFFALFIGLSSSLCLIVTSIFMLLGAPIIMIFAPDS